MHTPETKTARENVKVVATVDGEEPTNKKSIIDDCTAMPECCSTGTAGTAYSLYELCCRYFSVKLSLRKDLTHLCIHGR